MKIQETINDLFKHLSIYPVIICGWFIVVLNFLIFSNLHCANTKFDPTFVSIIISSICIILLGLSIVIEIVCNIISYEVKNEFIINNKLVKVFGIIGILVTLIAVPIGFLNFIWGSEYINTLLFYQMFFVFI